MTMLEFLRRSKAGKGRWGKNDPELESAYQHFKDARLAGWIVAPEAHRSSRRADSAVDFIKVMSVTAAGEQELARLAKA